MARRCCSNCGFLSWSVPTGRCDVAAKAWGGVFGGELVASVTDDALVATPTPSSPVTPLRVVGPCLDEDAHADACSCSSDPFSC